MASQALVWSVLTRLNIAAKDSHKSNTLQANKMVLCMAPFRLSSVIEAAMEIAGPGAAMKRLQVHLLRCATGNAESFAMRHRHSSLHLSIPGLLHAR